MSKTCARAKIFMPVVLGRETRLRIRIYSWRAADEEVRASQCMNGHFGNRRLSTCCWKSQRDAGGNPVHLCWNKFTHPQICPLGFFPAFLWIYSPPCSSSELWHTWQFNIKGIPKARGRISFLAINVTLKFFSSLMFQEHLKCAWPAPCGVPTF